MSNEGKQTNNTFIKKKILYLKLKKKIIFDGDWLPRNLPKTEKVIENIASGVRYRGS